MERIKSDGLFRVDGTGIKMTELMEIVYWPINKFSKIAETLFEYFSIQHSKIQNEKLAKYEEEINYFLINEYEMQDEERPDEELELSNTIKDSSLQPDVLRRIPSMKPRTLAAKLGTSRDIIYKIKREIKRQQHSERNKFPKISKQVKFNKQALLDAMTSF